MIKRFWIHTRHPIALPCETAMGCLLWIFCRELIMSELECIVKLFNWKDHSRDCLINLTPSVIIKYGWSWRGQIYSLWPRDAIWRQRSGSTLAQVMACCLTAPSHYLKQCWLIISEVQWHSYQSNFTRDASTVNHSNLFECLKFHSNFPGANELMIYNTVIIQNYCDAIVYLPSSSLLVLSLTCYVFCTKIMPKPMFMFHQLD